MENQECRHGNTFVESPLTIIGFAEAGNFDRGLDNSSYHARTEFHNFFLIQLKVKKLSNYFVRKPYSFSIFDIKEF